MRWIPAVLVLFLFPVPAHGARVTLEGGWSLPRGSFAEPTQFTRVPKGAERSFTFGLKYERPLVAFDLVAELSYVQFGEKYEGPEEIAETKSYTHTFIPITIGLRRDLLRSLLLHPYLGASAGLYGYMARGDALVPRPGTSEYDEESFTAVIRPGLAFSTGLILDTPFRFDLATEVKYHVMIFQGVGDDRADREYPYSIDVDSLTFATVTVGLVF